MAIPSPSTPNDSGFFGRTPGGGFEPGHTAMNSNRPHESGADAYSKNERDYRDMTVTGTMAICDCLIDLRESVDALTEAVAGTEVAAITQPISEQLADIEKGDTVTVAYLSNFGGGMQERTGTVHDNKPIPRTDVDITAQLVIDPGDGERYVAVNSDGVMFSFDPATEGDSLRLGEARELTKHSR